MKTGLITFHAAMNYGSALQAYALQKYLEGRGHDVEIIDFRSLAQRRLYPAPVCFNSVYNAKQTLRRLASGWDTIGFMRRKRMAFSRFMNEQMNLTSCRFGSGRQLRRHDWSSYDMLVSGSDQIWNPSAIDFSLAYFLDFAESTQAQERSCLSGCSRGPCKVAYAPSAGPAPRLRQGLGTEIRRLLSQYSAVSVRETQTAGFLQENGLVGSGCNGGIPVLPDPVLLHDAAFWRALASSEDCAAADNALPGKYILYYAPGRGSREAEMTADALSAGMLGHGTSSVRQGSARIPVLVVSDGASAGQGYGSPSAGVSMRRHVPCGPAGFISLVDSAECTVGTSYHLMLFSMILGKDFWCPDASSDSRKLQLLASAGLSADSRLFRFSDPAVRARTVSAAAAMHRDADSFFSRVAAEKV